MADRSSRVYFLQHLLRTLRRKRETVAFPQGELEIPDHYQGQISVDIEQCRACQLCVRVCPAAALELTSSRNGARAMLVYHDRCAICGLCELVCPAGAIRRGTFFSTGATQRDSLREEWRREGDD